MSRSSRFAAIRVR